MVEAHILPPLRAAPEGPTLTPGGHQPLRLPIMRPSRSRRSRARRRPLLARRSCLELVREILEVARHHVEVCLRPQILLLPRTMLVRTRHEGGPKPEAARG